jgi:hypothetical protein
LGTNVTELCSNAEKELVLGAEWLLHITGQVRALLGLKRHIGICDFWDWREEEDNGQEEDEGSYAHIGPLHFRQIGGGGVLEEDTGGEKRCHDRANSLE